VLCGAPLPLSGHAAWEERGVVRSPHRARDVSRGVRICKSVGRGGRLSQSKTSSTLSLTTSAVTALSRSLERMRATMTSPSRSISRSAVSASSRLGTSERGIERTPIAKSWRIRVVSKSSERPRCGSIGAIYATRLLRRPVSTESGVFPPSVDNLDLSRRLSSPYAPQGNRCAGGHSRSRLGSLAQPEKATAMTFKCRRRMKARG
jgi:hypothetical protein